MYKMRKNGLNSSSLNIPGRIKKLINKYIVVYTRNNKGNMENKKIMISFK